MDTFAQSAGLVVEGDFISLSAELRLRPSGRGWRLCDAATGARHQVAVAAIEPLRLLARGQYVGRWLDQPSVQKLPTGQALQMLEFLNDIAALDVQRTFRQSAAVFIRRLRLLAWGAPFPHNAQRYPATWPGLARMIIRSLLPIIAALFCTAILAYGANIPLGAYLVAQALFLTCLVFSTTAHEAVHWRFATPSAAGCFVRRGLRLGFLHTPLAPTQEFRSALAGPLAGVLVAGLMATLALALQVPAFATVSALAVAVFHSLSWLPWYGDGHVLWQQVKNRRGHHA